MHSLEMQRNLVTANFQQSNGAVQILSYTPFTLTNNVIADNTPGNGTGAGGVEIKANSPGDLLHNTIAHNVQTSGDTLGGVGIRISEDARVDLVNNIIANHTGTNGVGLEVHADGTSAYTQTTNSTALWHGNITHFVVYPAYNHTGDKYGDPVFASPSYHNYHIESTSAAIGQAVDADVPIDKDGVPRPWGGSANFDIGAYEYFTPENPIRLPLVMRRYP